MPTDTKRTALKTLLLAPVPPIQIWAFRQFAAGDPVAGAIAFAAGVLLTAAYVVIQEYDLPYEEEILSIVADNVAAGDDEAVADAVTEMAEETSDAVSDSRSGPGRQ